MAWFNVLIGPCGIETRKEPMIIGNSKVLIGPCGIETYNALLSDFP